MRKETISAVSVPTDSIPSEVNGSDKNIDPIAVAMETVEKMQNFQNVVKKSETTTGSSRFSIRRALASDCGDMMR